MKNLILFCLSFTTGFAQLHIDCGSNSSSVDAFGSYLPDTFFVGGNTITAATGPRALLRSVRYGNFSYNIPAAPGSYYIVLHFYDAYSNQPGQRTMNIAVNGNQVLGAFDAYGQGEVVKTFPVTVAGGFITITFTTVVKNAMVAGIDIIPSVVQPLSLERCHGEGPGWSCAGIYRLTSGGNVIVYGVPPTLVPDGGLGWELVLLNDICVNPSSCVPLPIYQD